MLNKFIEWANKFAAESSERGVVAKITESEMSDNPSARLDIDTPTKVARITFWESGDYFAEILNNKTGQSMFLSRGSFDINLDFSNEFVGFFERLND